LLAASGGNEAFSIRKTVANAITAHSEQIFLSKKYSWETVLDHALGVG
jgi:hypothetical protein